MPQFAELRDRYRSGQLARDEYWRAAQEEHTRFRTYMEVLRDTPVRAIRITADDLVLELDTGLRMLWIPEDLRAAPNMLLNQGGYEEVELEVLQRIAAGRRTILDIGANAGWYSLHFAQRVAAEGGAVHAFEPIPETFETLQRNVALNGYQGTVVCHQLGLADTAGEVTFYLPEETGSVAASQRALFADQQNRRVTCRTDTLDAVVEREGIRDVELVKCDVEGGELFVLRGATRTIEGDRPVLFLEILRKWSRTFDYDPDQIVDFLAERGYRALAVGGAGVRALATIDERCEETNFLFLHQEAHATLAAELLTGMGAAR